jgi:isoleucyl-tRNA synthetase
VLTNWYVRRSRDRFWAGTGTGLAPDTRAFDTLYTVLETVTRVTAPLLPLVSERIWKDLTGGRSVHLEDWPEPDDLPADDRLVEVMDRVRQVASTALSLRKQSGLRVRQPLARLTVVSDDADGLARFEDILRDELNVKAVSVEELTPTSAADAGITRRLTVNARVAGPRLGKGVQQVIQAARSGDWTEADGEVVAGGVPLVAGEYELVLEVAGDRADQALALLPGGGFLLLDTALTAELEAEGLARDVVRNVQDARKGAGLDVSDRIALVIRLDAAGAEQAERFRDLIARETLAVALRIDAVAEASTSGITVGGGSPLDIEVERA